MPTLPKLARHDWTAEQLATKADTADLGTAALLDVGTTAGTVMAADDERVTSLPSTYEALSSDNEVGWVHWGDSLTAAQSWVAAWAALDGRAHIDKGIGGQRPEHVSARAGGIMPLVTVTGGSIPASGAVAATVVPEPLNANGAITGTLANVPGSLARSTGAWTFTRTTPGTAVAVEAGSVFTPTDAVTYRKHRQVIGVSNGAKYDLPADFVRPIVAMAQRSQSRHRIITDAAPSSDITGPQLTNLTNCNTLLSTTFPTDYYAVWAAMRTSAAFSAAGAVQSTQDAIDIAGSITPQTFRRDGIHQNTLGNRALGYLLSAEAYRRRLSHVGPTLDTSTYTQLLAVPAPSRTTAAGWTGSGGNSVPVTNAAGVYTEESLAWSPTGDGVRLVGVAGANTPSHVQISVGAGGVRPLVTPGATYSASMFVKCSKSITVKLRLRWVKGVADSYAITADVVGETVTLEAGYPTWLTVTGVAPTGTVHGMVTVMGVKETLEDGSTLEAGGPMLHQGSIPLPCHTGADAGWAWSGIEWNSPSSGPISAWLGV